MMRRVVCVLLGFVLGTGLSNVKAQEEQAQSHAASHDLTVQELLSIMADFDIRHTEQQPFGTQVYGATIYAISPPTIYIFGAQPYHSKIGTAIHESLHIRCHRMLVECQEEWVLNEEMRQYKKIFLSQP
jgi:hypothetical protein